MKHYMKEKKNHSHWYVHESQCIPPISPFPTLCPPECSEMPQKSLSLSTIENLLLQFLPTRIVQLLFDLQWPSQREGPSAGITTQRIKGCWVAALKLSKLDEWVKNQPSPKWEANISFHTQHFTTGLWICHIYLSLYPFLPPLLFFCVSTLVECKLQKWSSPAGAVTQMKVVELPVFQMMVDARVSLPLTLVVLSDKWQIKAYWWGGNSSLSLANSREQASTSLAQFFFLD